MEPKNVEYESWDDLVFEHRNKAYGAYALRKSYSNQVLLGFGLSVALIAILLFLPKGAKPEIIPIAELPPIILDPPPVIERNRQPVRPQPPVRRTEQVNTNTTPLVVTEPVETTPVENAQVEVTGSVNGVEGGTGVIESPVTGIGNDMMPIVEEPKEFTIVEQMPAYTGGDRAMYEFISRKMRYPAAPRRMGIDGTVYVSFLVMGDGSVADVKVIRGIHHDCDSEAVRVISMLPGWVGGKQGGRPVSVRMVLPIKFELK